MQLLISDPSELTMLTRQAEIQLFFQHIGYQLTYSDADGLQLKSAYATVQLTTPVLFVRYDREHFLSVRMEKVEQQLPYVQ
ncbi:hypothetical protein FD04_GL000769 [Secundilactobacillus odoratitofui DSM 19909 = JCM 15043]|uniref:Uncharacterized protein n=1 Tax=Secundilactobacillus odoratitofui DSM 19909 = JCM 15043 TaxID=1423776 RepID=A0A0R1M1G6_9LACO|nr:hypothetical protein [Secundilactobacillus odoratitofui]KRK97799.1 hypothetical protein FD04_GL000769 [Secundilactobacillus odoratitofui DSM 19909 = JCM 15043]